MLRGQQIGTNAPKFKDQQKADAKAAKAKGKKANGFMGRSVRNEQYRYTEWGKDGENGVTLFDMVADPIEAKDLSKDPAHAEALKAMKALLK